MKTDKPLKPGDFGLSKTELTELVGGAQTFLKPGPDPLDAERFLPGATVELPSKKSQV